MDLQNVVEGAGTCRGKKTAQQDGYGAGGGGKKLDTDVGSAMREKTRAGGGGAKAKKDTPAARSAR